MLVFIAVDSTEVPHDCTPSHVMSQLCGAPRHLSSLHDCKPGQAMSQASARQTMGAVEQDLAPLHFTAQLLPAQLTPPRQLASPHVTSQRVALVQSTP